LKFFVDSTSNSHIKFCSKTSHFWSRPFWTLRLFFGQKRVTFTKLTKLKILFLRYRPLSKSCFGKIHWGYVQKTVWRWISISTKLLKIENLEIKENKGYVLEKNVIWDFFLELDVESHEKCIVWNSRPMAKFLFYFASWHGMTHLSIFGTKAHQLGAVNILKSHRTKIVP
jgi:hypothetical protein